MIQKKKKVGYISIDNIRKRMRFFISLWLLIGIKMFAQQETQYTQYMYNLSSINPGGLAINDEFKIYGSSRYQWVGLEGAPLTQFLSIESPLNYRNTSIGANIVNDKIGPLTETEFVANIAHYVPLFDNDRRLSLGLRVGGRFFNVDWGQGEFEFDDPVFRENVNEFLMVVGAGIYYQSKTLFGGVGVNNLLPNKTTVGNLSNEIPHYNFIVGYNFHIENDITIKPILFSTIVDGGAIRIEGSATFTYNDKYFGGLSYKYQSGVGVVFGMQITPKINIGYSYDISLAETANLGLSSHEILATYIIKTKPYKRERRY